MKLRAYIEIKRFDEKTRAIEYNVGFFEMSPNEIVFSNKVVLKVYEIIRKHLEKWYKTH